MVDIIVLIITHQTLLLWRQNVFTNDGLEIYIWKAFPMFFVVGFYLQNHLNRPWLMLYYSIICIPNE